MISKLPQNWGQMAEIRHRAPFILLLGILGIFAWNMYSYLGVNWELLQTKHYFEGSYYGGFTNTVYDDGNGLTTFQAESVPCLNLVDSFLSKTGGAQQYSQPTDVDRIFTCGFVPSLVARLGFSKIRMTQSIEITNIIFWLGFVVLIALLVRLWFADGVTPLIGAAIAAGYPIHGLLTTSFKTQLAGADLLLAWVYIERTAYSRLGWMERGVVLVTAFTLTMLAAGAAYFIFAYMLLLAFYKALTEPEGRLDALLDITVACCAFAIGEVFIRVILRHYNTATSLQTYGLGGMFMESLHTLWVSLSGGDITGMRFLNYPGYSYFTSILPWFLWLFFQSNPVICVVSLIGGLMSRAMRIVFLLFPVLFVLGHAPVVVAGGWTYYYGYSSAPAAYLLILATALCIGALSNRGARLTAVAIALGTIAFFNIDPAFNFKNHYSNRDAIDITKHLYVYHDLSYVQYW